MEYKTYKTVNRFARKKLHFNPVVKWVKQQKGRVTEQRTANAQASQTIEVVQASQPHFTLLIISQQDNKVTYFGYFCLNWKLPDLLFISKFWIVICSKLNIQSSGLVRHKVLALYWSIVAFGDFVWDIAVFAELFCRILQCSELPISPHIPLIFSYLYLPKWASSYFFNHSVYCTWLSNSSFLECKGKGKIETLVLHELFSFAW